MKDRQFMPNIAASMAKSTLGPKSIWIPFIEDALKTCDEYGKDFDLIHINFSIYSFNISLYSTAIYYN